MTKSFAEFISKNPLSEQINYCLDSGDLKDFIRRYTGNSYSLDFNKHERKELKAVKTSFAVSQIAKQDSLYDICCRTLDLYIKYLEIPQGNSAIPNKREIEKPKIDQTCPEEEKEYTEGKIRQVSVTKHERSRKLRQACLRHWGYTCQVCGMDFESVYGELGKDYIEVHHLTMISKTVDEHNVDPQKDLVPLCANCHAMIHKSDPSSLEKLKAIYEQNNR